MGPHGWIATTPADTQGFDLLRLDRAVDVLNRVLARACSQELSAWWLARTGLTEQRQHPRPMIRDTIFDSSGLLNPVAKEDKTRKDCLCPSQLCA